LGRSLEKLGKIVRKTGEGFLWCFMISGRRRGFRDGGDGEADRPRDRGVRGIPGTVADHGVGKARVGAGPGAGGAGGIRGTRAGVRGRDDG
jgi:hypothetical protein